jgi:small subunit ribosomal protein S16
MVVIRLARGGDKKNPFYRIVAADKRCRRDGRFIEQIGYYDPMARGQATPLQIDLERITHWQDKGAQLSDRVSAIVKKLKQGKTFTAMPRVAEQKTQQAEKASEQQKKKLEAEKKAALEAAKAEEAEKKAAAEAEKKSALEAAKAEEAEKKAATEAPAETEKPAAEEAPKADDSADK